MDNDLGWVETMNGGNFVINVMFSLAVSERVTLHDVTLGWNMRSAATPAPRAYYERSERRRITNSIQDDHPCSMPVMIRCCGCVHANLPGSATADMAICWGIYAGQQTNTGGLVGLLSA